MGEWSKKVGEVGEQVAGDFLRLIGWGASQVGIQLLCLKTERHGASGHERRTHGIDYLFTYKSPLVDQVLVNLVISVKYSADPYPRNPTNKFKEHLTDLAQTLECFKNSIARRELIKGVKGVTKAQDIGVLIWINNDKRGEQDVIRQVQRAVLPDSIGLEIAYLVDNRRAQFIFDSIRYARKLTNEGEVTFFAPDTGKNLDAFARVRHCQVLPVEYVNSAVLALGLVDKGSTRRSLMLSTLEPFSEAGLKRLMGLAQHLSQGWCNRVVITFSDFDQLHHANAVQATKGCFSDTRFSDGVEVHGYDDDFRTLNH
jgi:hypothetical protein